MAPFRYEQFQSPFSNTIAQLLAHQGDPQALAAQQVAAANARAGEIAANAWGGVAQTVGQSIGHIGDTIAREQEIAPKLAQEKIALADAQEKQRGERDLNTALAGDTLAPGAEGPRLPTFTKPDGHYDIPGLTQWLNSQGHGAHTPDLVAHAELQNENLDKAQAAQEAAGIKRQIYVGGIAQTALELNQRIGVPYEAGVKFGAQQGIQTKQFTQQQLDGVLQQLGQLPPDQQTAFLQSYVEAADRAQAPTIYKEGEVGIGKTSGTPLYTAPEKHDIAWMRADAGTIGTDHETKTAQDSLRGLQAGKAIPKEPARTAEQDDERYRNIGANIQLGKPNTPEDLAWMKSYEKQKLLGPQLTIGAAAERLGETFAHQDEELAKRDVLQTQRTGREYLSNKVNAEYFKRTEAADTMEKTVRLAIAGNMTAAQLQNLELTMGAIRAQNLNRINSAEIKNNEQAGSLWTNAESWVGKKLAGQPVPKELQDSIIQFAQMLRQQAEYTYLKEFGNAKTLYKLGDDIQPLVKPKQYNPATGKVE